VNTDWECTKEKMDAYCREIRKLEAKFYGLEFHPVPRDDNVAADVLSKLGSKRALVPAGVFVQALNSPTVKVKEEPPSNPDLVPALGQQVLTLDTDSQSPIIDFIKKNKSYPKGRSTRSLHGAQEIMLSSDLSCSGTRHPREPCANTSHRTKESDSSAKSTRAFAATTQEPPPLWAKPSD